MEIAVPRQQLAGLHRQVPRPRYTPAGRMLLAALAKLLPRERWAVFLVRRRRCCAGIAAALASRVDRPAMDLPKDRS